MPLYQGVRIGIKPFRCLSGVALAAMALAAALRPLAQENDAKQTGGHPLRVMIVGGGPNPDHNQVAIESNVRYVSRLLPPDSRRTALFADGDINNPTVLYVDDVKALPAEQEVLALLTQGNDHTFTAYGHYRKPNVGGSLDGPSNKQSVARQMELISQETPPPRSSLLLYFTGHGSPQNNNLDNNYYDLWGRGGALSVRELADQIAHLPPDLPVAVVMVQCFSGAFGNLLFEGGDPNKDYIDRDLVGFFATTKNRMAAGCTPAVNEADYHDFTSYFFAALTGQDRLGRKVTGADYDRNGHVSMDEAFCYTLIHDDSIDVPVCTSDVLLRHDVPFKEEEIAQTRYSNLKKWATRAQKAALDGLSAKLNLTGEDREAVAEREQTPRRDPQTEEAYRVAAQRFGQLRRDRRTELLRRFPDLRSRETTAYENARQEALAQIADQIKAGEWKDLLDAYDAFTRAEDAQEEGENQAARALRFVRLSTSIVLAHRLMQTGTPEQKARFARLQAAEHRTLLQASVDVNPMPDTQSDAPAN